MPITKSAKKALRQNERRKARNLLIKRKIKKLTKQARKLSLEDAKKLLPELYQAFDKAAKRGILKKNTAARRKAKYARLLK